MQLKSLESANKRTLRLPLKYKFNLEKPPSSILTDTAKKMLYQAVKMYTMM